MKPLKLARDEACPWCGRTVVLRRSGVLPRHKRVTGADQVTGAVYRDWCAGGGELAYGLGHEQRSQFRAQWRDDGGELIGAES